MPSSSYFFNVISHSKDIDQFTQGEIDKDYKPFVINKMVAKYANLVIFADEMNNRPNISKRDQIHLYMILIPKKNRRVLWSQDKKNDNLEVVMDYYHITQDKAEPYLRILTDNQIDQLRLRLNTGGRD